MKKFEKFENLSQKKENIPAKTLNFAPVLIKFLPTILNLLPKLQNNLKNQTQANQKIEIPHQNVISSNSKLALKTLHKHNETIAKLKTKKP